MLFIFSDIYSSCLFRFEFIFRVRYMNSTSHQLKTWINFKLSIHQSIKCPIGQLIKSDVLFQKLLLLLLLSFVAKLRKTSKQLSLHLSLYIKLNPTFDLDSILKKKETLTPCLFYPGLKGCPFRPGQLCPVFTCRKYLAREE